VGVLGNSGEGGTCLVRVGELSFDRSATGVALDRDWTLWVSGGDTINRVGLDGRLIERFPLEPAGSSVDSKTFAAVDDTLYFLGHVPDGAHAIFGLAMSGKGERVARPLPLKLPERRQDWVGYCLAPQPVRGRLVVVAEVKRAAEPLIGVYLVDPHSASAEPPRPEFTRPGAYPQGVAVDEARGLIYLGGSFGRYVAGETHDSTWSITAIRADGSPGPGDFTVACPKTPAIPTEFRGVISLAAGALWDTAWYGFLARLDLQGRGAPGRIVQWHHDLGYSTQLVGISEGGSERPDLLGIACAMPDSFYLAHWRDDAQQLDLVRRIGCLPVISSLGLSDDGWVTVGTMRAQLWWRWEAAADAPPEKAELHIGVTPGHFEQDRFFTLAAQYRLDDLTKRSPVACVFSPRVGDRNEATRTSDPVPMARPVGLSVRATPGQPNGTVFATDLETKQIWRTSIRLPDLRPDNANWRAVNTGEAALQSPTDVIALTDGRLLVADEGRVRLLEPQGEGYRQASCFERWGDGAAEHFGKRIRVAADGPWLLVSDTDRHRVVWLDWTTWKVLGQFGETDALGDDAQHLNGPTLLALRGTRAAVADAGNQRVLKLSLEP